MDKEAGRGKSLRICIITAPFSRVTSGYSLLYNLIEIIEPITSKLHVITGNIPKNKLKNKYIINLKIDLDSKLIKKLVLFRIFKRIHTQIEICYNIFKIRKKVNIVIFFLEPYYILPTLLTKILRKKVIRVVTAFSSKHAIYNPSFSSFLIHCMYIHEKIAFTLSDCLIIDQKSIHVFDHLFGLNKYKNKIAFQARHVNLNTFKIYKKIEVRENVIGFVGRFSGEKGINNFVDSIPIVFEKINVKFLLIGDGPLFSDVKEKLKNFQNSVTLKKWVSNDKLPCYLNELKLLVIPSYIETGPFIAIEAMACGTSVLGTRVGLLSDILKDGETGFILEDNSPECIAENIIIALEHPNLREIVKNARELVEKEFTYEAAVERYRKILEEIYGH